MDTNAIHAAFRHKTKMIPRNPSVVGNRGMTPNAGLKESSKTNVPTNPKGHDEPQLKPQSTQHSQPQPVHRDSEAVQNTEPKTPQTPKSSTRPAWSSPENTQTPAQHPQALQENTMPTEEMPQKTAPTKSDFVPVDISIAGTPHRIVCPTNEVVNLEKAVAYINTKMRSIRQEIRGKTPTNEELLVLTCLEMYDQIKGLQDETQRYQDEQQTANELLTKMLNDLNAVL